MNEKIASILKSKIEPLSFVDKIAGLVRPVKIEVMGANEVKVPKIYPIASDISGESCISGQYKDLVPDSKYRSIFYFEDNGLTLTARNNRWASFNSRLTLVGWLNLKMLFDCQTFTGSTECILSILSELPENPFSEDIYREIRIIALSEVPKSNAIFSRYTYDEIKTQYLLYPFDYLALNMSIDFKINLACVEQFKLASCPKC
jgi:hypothetical protein